MTSLLVTSQLAASALAASFCIEAYSCGWKKCRSEFPGKKENAEKWRAAGLKVKKERLEELRKAGVKAAVDFEL